MTHLFVPYELALLSKEKGFDEPCISFYPKDDSMGFNGKYHSVKDGYRNSTVNDIWIKRYGNDFKCVTAPLYQQLTDWFDIKGIFINATHEKIGYTNEEDSTPLTVLKWEYHITKVDALSTYNFSHIKAECNFKTKREALNKAIEEALKLI